MRVRMLIPRRRPKKLVARSAKRSAQMTLMICLVAFAASMYALLGEGGVMAVMKMRARAAQLQYQILSMERANQELRDAIRPLREQDPDAIEKLAREQLFMVRPGDTIYMVPTTPTPGATTQPQAGRIEPTSPTAPARPRRR